MTEHERPLHRRVTEGNSRLQVPPGSGVFTQIEQGTAKFCMCFQAGSQRAGALHQPIELFT
jgi:hypothetical protein